MSNNIDISTFGKHYITNLMKHAQWLEYDTLQIIADKIMEFNAKNSTIYFFGNGGSAATATHFSCDIGKGCNIKDFYIKTESPMDNLAIMSAYYNDSGYEVAVQRYIEDRVTPQDLVVFISASGNSKNLVNAALYCRKHEIPTIGLLGFDGGQLAEICETNIIIKTPKGEYGPVEDLHMILCHLISNYIQIKVVL